MAQNYSFHAISAAFILAAAPAVYAGFRMLLASGRLDNAQPRQYLEKLQGKIPAETHAELTRARNACANGQEHFPLFVAAVFAANIAHFTSFAASSSSPDSPARIDTAAITANANTLAVKYLLGRLAFTVLYIKTPQSVQSLTYVRSGVWMYVTYLCISQLVQSGSQFL